MSNSIKLRHPHQELIARSAHHTSIFQRCPKGGSKRYVEGPLLLLPDKKNEMRLFVFLQRCRHRQFFFVAVDALIIYAVS